MANPKIPVRRVGSAAPIDRFISPFQEFLHRQTSGGILLFLCTLLALGWANSPWAAPYFSTFNSMLTVELGGVGLSKPLLLWINDGLMAIFFFVVGLEIKREVVAGELTSLRKASLPIAAALGGMMVPAGLYAVLNYGTEGAHGWGIPMATDIAFSLGVLQLLGKRVPLSLKVFLTAFAIADDIGAVLVIALFYTAKVSGSALALSAVLLGLAILLNVLGVRRPVVYALVGVVLWVAILKSGVHATVAGVLMAMTIPARTRIAEAEFLDNGKELLHDFETAGPLDTDTELNEARHAVLNSMQEMAEGLRTPVSRLEDEMHPYVTFLILPIFALANAGVNLSDGGVSALTHPVSLGIILGLVFGKLIGISFFSWLAVRLNIASLPAGVTWRHIIGAACLGGIGFTMSLFVANLAFGNSKLLEISKMGILAASLIAGVGGFLIIRSATREPVATTDPEPHEEIPH